MEATTSDEGGWGFDWRCAIFAVFLVGAVMKCSWFADRESKPINGQEGRSQTTTARKSVASPDLQFCILVMATWKEYNLNPSTDVGDIGRRCGTFADTLRSTGKARLSPRLRAWARQYEDALYEVDDAIAEFAYLNSNDRVSQKMLESLLRGSMGDPFGTALEETALHQQAGSRMKSAITDARRLEQEFAAIVSDLE